MIEETRKCENESCGAIFFTTHGNKRYCSEKCRRSNQPQAVKAYNGKRPKLNPILTRQRRDKAARLARIKKLLASGMNQKQIAAKEGISKQRISKILKEERERG